MKVFINVYGYNVIFDTCKKECVYSMCHVSNLGHIWRLSLLLAFTPGATPRLNFVFVTLLLKKNFFF